MAHVREFRIIQDENKLNEIKLHIADDIVKSYMSFRGEQNNTIRINYNHSVSEYNGYATQEEVVCCMRLKFLLPFLQCIIMPV